MPVLTLLTDFGHDDYYVAAVKGVLLGRIPLGSVVVDVSHSVTPGDVEGAAFLLAATAPWFPEGTVHLAVVDPGVGGDRRLLAARSRRAFFIAPDNGLLTPLLEAAELRSVERSELFLEGPGATFHGRDRFAPVAAALVRGEPFNSLGPEIHDPVRLELPQPRRRSGRLIGRIAHIDRFGNLVTDIPAAWLPPSGFEARVGSHPVRVKASHYAELEPGQPALIGGSLGTLEVSLLGESLAERWDVSRGTAVVVDFR